MDEDDIGFLRDAADDAAFDRFVRRHMGDVYRYVTCRIGPDRALGVTADVMRRARDRADRCTTEASSTEPWLLGMASLAVDGHGRAEAAYLARLADETTGIAPGARALAGMKTPRRDALLLTEAGGLTPQQTAEVLGVPVGTAVGWIEDARARLPGGPAEVVRELAPGPPGDLAERVLARTAAPAAVTSPAASRPDPAPGPLHRSSLVAAVVLALVASIAALVLGRGSRPSPVLEARVDWGMLVTFRVYPPPGVPMEDIRVGMTSDLGRVARGMDGAGVAVVSAEEDRITVRLPGVTELEDALPDLSAWRPTLSGEGDPHDPVFKKNLLARLGPAEREQALAMWDAVSHQTFLAPFSVTRYGVVPTISTLPVVVSPVDDDDAGRGVMRWHRLAGGHFDGADYRLLGGERNGRLDAVAVVGGSDVSSGPDQVWDVFPVCRPRIGTPRVVVCATENDTTSRTVVHRSFGRAQGGAGRIAVTFAGVTRKAIIQNGWWFARIDVTATPRTMSAADARIVAWDRDGRRIPIVTDPGDGGCCLPFP